MQRGYQHGDDFSADRQRIEEGLMERLNPSLAIERNKYEQQLADQGIRLGSPAYDNAMRNYSMQANDARLGVIGAGRPGAAAAVGDVAAGWRVRQQGAAADLRAGQGPRRVRQSAQQQATSSSSGAGNSTTPRSSRTSRRRRSAARSPMPALAQNFGQAQTAFNASNAARQQYLNEQFALRNQPINEISALLTGSQVSQPNFVNPNTSTIANTDVAGLINKNFDQQMAVSNQQAATANNIIGGLFGFAGGLGRGGAFKQRRAEAMSDAYISSFSPTIREAAR